MPHIEHSFIKNTSDEHMMLHFGGVYTFISESFHVFQRVILSKAAAHGRRHLLRATFAFRGNLQLTFMALGKVMGSAYAAE